MNVFEGVLSFGLSHLVDQSEFTIADVVVGSVVPFLAPVAFGLPTVTEVGRTIYGGDLIVGLAEDD